jgi:hypothetical protein
LPTTCSRLPAPQRHALEVALLTEAARLRAFLPPGAKDDIVTGKP